MRFLNFPARACLFALASTVILGACRLKPKVLKSPPHYNFSQVYEEKLDLKLREISGICWDPKNNFFAAVNDESGTLFLLDKESKQIINEYPFGPKGDYEDVAILNGTIYVLESKGLIIRMQKDSAGDYKGVNVGTVPLNGTNDFETMYGDPTRKALVILCKNCSEDKENEVNAYAFYPDSIGFDNNRSM